MFGGIFSHMHHKPVSQWYRSSILTQCKCSRCVYRAKSPTTHLSFFFHSSAAIFSVFQRRNLYIFLHCVRRARERECVSLLYIWNPCKANETLTHTQRLGEWNANRNENMYIFPFRRNIEKKKNERPTLAFRKKNERSGGERWRKCVGWE